MPIPALFAALCVAAALASSCATAIRLGEGAEPLALLSPDLAAYLAIDGDVARRLVPSLLDESEAASLRPLLERTTSAALGLGPADSSGARRIEAALVGDYPFRRAGLALAADRAWKREGDAYLHRATGIRALPAGPGLVLASTGSVEPLAARARQPGASPLPARLEPLAGKALVLWAPDPLSRLAPGLVGDQGPGASMPLRGLLVAADARPDGSYLATVAFLMADAESARIYRPALRLAWYFLARGTLGDSASSVPGARFSLDGELVYASDVVIPGEAARQAMAKALPGR